MGSILSHARVSYLVSKTNSIANILATGPMMLKKSKTSSGP